jgi:myo-inositol-1(or 4)-monophosphatase
MVTEAGGKVTNFKGANFSIYDEEILASNGWIHEEMLRVIQEVAGNKP